MPLQSVSVAFKKAAESIIKRSSNDIAGGIVCVATELEDNIKKFSEFKEFEDWNKTSKAVADAKVLNSIKLMFIGNAVKPKAVVLAFTTYTDDTDIEAILRKLSEMQAVYIAIIGFGDDTTEVETECGIFAEENKDMFFIGHVAVDDMYSICCVEDMKFKDCDGNSMPALVAGMCAGTPITQAITNSVIDNALISEFTTHTKEEYDNYIDSGKLVIIYDNGKYRIGRGVNSLTTIGSDMVEGMKKIKIASAMRLMSKDITDIIKDNYIGKLPNTYDNKCVVIAMINEYLTGLSDEDVIDSGFSVDIDIESQKTYLKSKGIDTSDMDDDEIKEYNTDDKVFLKLTVKFIDAMEDVSIAIMI